MPCQCFSLRQLCSVACSRETLAPNQGNASQEAVWSVKPVLANYHKQVGLAGERQRLPALKVVVGNHRAHFACSTEKKAVFIAARATGQGLQLPGSPPGFPPVALSRTTPDRVAIVWCRTSRLVLAVPGAAVEETRPAAFLNFEPTCSKVVVTAHMETTLVLVAEIC